MKILNKILTKPLNIKDSHFISITCEVLILLLVVLSFTTCEKPERIAKINTLETSPESISYTSVVLKCELTDLGSAGVEEFGIEVSKNASYQNSIITPKDTIPAKGIFKISVSSLEKDVSYYYRAYVTVNSKSTYGASLRFKTRASEIATVTAGAISNLTLTTATLNGEVTLDGGEPVTKRGLCWGTSAGPTLESCLDTTINGSGTGTFTGLMHDLTAGTTYYARSYAINAKGTSYNSADIPFTTQNLPEAVTTAANPVQNTTATLNGTVNANNLSSVVTFEYGTTTAYGQTANAIQSPVTGNSTTNVSASITGLNPGTLYHFRVRAVSSAGTSLGGSDLTFTTLEPPVATTSPVTPVANTTATLNGTVNAKNSSTTVTFEYGETTAYGQTVTATPATVTGNTATPVSSDITGLTQGTEYHFRVKASSAGGQSDGLDQTFITLQPPVAVTGAADNVTSTGATFNGTINARNSSTIVEFEYGPTTSYGTTVTATPSPVTGNTVTNVSATVSGLSSSTIYHFRVKGNSPGGIANGDDGTFFTSTATATTVADYDGNIYNIVTIGTQEWMQANLKTTHYNNGEVIPNVTDPTTWGGLSSGAFSWYENDPATFKETFGALYNWYSSSDVRNVCPEGWQVPSDADFKVLEIFLGMTSEQANAEDWRGLDQGIQLKSQSANGTNNSGFTGYLGGYRDFSNGSFQNYGNYGAWWSLDEYSSSRGWDRVLYAFYSSVRRNGSMKNSGYSIRCLKKVTALAVTSLATAVSSKSVTLDSRVNPNGASTTVTFEYGTTTSYGTSVTASQSPATGSVPVNMSYNLSGLLPNTTYHYRVKAVNSGGTNYGGDITFTTPERVSDIDGNVYNTVTIGSQTWMKENLKTTKLNDGTPIPLVSNSSWTSLSTPGYGTTGLATFYNWLTVNTGMLCPTGWHVPSSNDFSILINFLGGNTVAGGKLKSIDYWITPNAGATNESGFTALGAGYRSDFDGSYYYIGAGGYWFTSTEANATQATILYLGWNYLNSFLSNSSKKDGCNIRCIKD